jgi:dienelactone hydrolase
VPHHNHAFTITSVTKTPNKLPRIVLAVALTFPVLARSAAADATTATTPARTPVTAGTPTAPVLPAPAWENFFTAPVPLPGRPGDVIWAAPSPEPVKDLYGTFTTNTELPYFSTWPTIVRPEVTRVLYHSTNRRGESVPAAALLITHPEKKGTSPIIVSVHGWRGLADRCGLFGAEGRGMIGYASALTAKYVLRGYSVIIPDGPGGSVTGMPTPLIRVDAARNMLDAAHAAQLHTGSTGPVLLHGHSLGGNAVLGAASEATTYAPGLRIAGVVSIAGTGYSGPGTLMHAALLDTADSSARAGTLIVYARMLEEAYPGEFQVRKHLTKKGLQRFDRVANMCADEITSLMIIDRVDELIKPSFWKLLDVDGGNFGHDTHLPLLLIDPTSDMNVNALPHRFVHRHRCERGRPTTVVVAEGTHVTAPMQAHNMEEVQAWVRGVLEGTTPVTGCSPVTDVLNFGHTYSVAYLSTAFGQGTVAGVQMKLRATGNCSVRKNVLYLELAGTCTFTIRSKPGKGPATTLTVTAAIR